MCFTTEAAGETEARTTSTILDAAGNAIASTDGNGIPTLFGMDRNYRPILTMNALGGFSRSFHDAVGNAIASTDPNGNRTESTFDKLNRRTTTEDALGGVGTLIYDKGSRVEAAVDENGNRTTFNYDAINRRVSTENANGDLSTVVYDKAGNVTETIDENGNRVTSTYDSLHRRVTTKDPLGNVVTNVYDDAGNVTKVTDARGNSATLTYDALNRRTQTENALGELSTVLYDKVGNVEATIDGRGNRGTFTYNALHQLTAQKNALGETVTTQYDTAGRVEVTIDALGNRTTYQYDLLGRQTSVEAPDGGITESVHDDAGNVVKIVDPLGNTSTTVYDALHRVVQLIDPLGGTTSFEYDSYGNRTVVIDPLGNRTTSVFDALHRETDQTDPNGNTATFAYDAAGRMTSMTDRLGRRIDYTYNDANRVLTEKWLNAVSAVINTLTFTYDANGNQLTAADQNGTLTSTYDALNRVETTKDHHNLSLTFHYDKASNVTKVEDSLGGIETSTYNAVNLLTKREFGGSGLTPLRFDQEWTERNQLKKITRYSDLAGTTKVGETDYAYDDVGRTTNIHHKDGSATSLANTTWSYDLAGRVETETIDGTTKTFTYDNTDQLTNDGTNAFSYDANGNRNMTGYTTGTGNQITNDGVFTYTHDAEGNRTKKSKGASLETWTHGYNHRNQIDWIEKRATDGGTLQLRIEYKYDAFDRRIEEAKWTSATGTVVTKFSHRGENIWADVDNASALIMRYIRPNGIDALGARIDSAGTAGWHLLDRQGTVIANMSNAGAILNRITYDGFGGITNQTGSGSQDRYKYTGREQDPDSGYQFHRRRYYDTRTGRWTSRDPIGFRAGDPNYYRYVGNNTPNAIDPSGLLEQAIGGAVTLEQLGPQLSAARIGPESVNAATNPLDPWGPGTIAFVVEHSIKLIDSSQELQVNPERGAPAATPAELIQQGPTTTGAALHWLDAVNFQRIRDYTKKVVNFAKRELSQKALADFKAVVRGIESLLDELERPHAQPTKENRLKLVGAAQLYASLPSPVELELSRIAFRRVGRPGSLTLSQEALGQAQKQLKGGYYQGSDFFHRHDAMAMIGTAVGLNIPSLVPASNKSLGSTVRDSLQARQRRLAALEKQQALANPRYKSSPSMSQAPHPSLRHVSRQLEDFADLVNLINPLEYAAAVYLAVKNEQWLVAGAIILTPHVAPKILKVGGIAYKKAIEVIRRGSRHVDELTAQGWGPVWRRFNKDNRGTLFPENAPSRSAMKSGVDPKKYASGYQAIFGRRNAPTRIPGPLDPGFIGPLSREQQYARLVRSNQPWNWKDDFPGGASLTASQRKAIRQNATAQGLIPSVPFKPGTRYPDFQAAGLLQRTDTLPQNLWQSSDYLQFQWLDARIPGGRPPGTTWHHTEIPGRMELVPFGPHNIINHRGGRSPGEWADATR